MSIFCLLLQQKKYPVSEVEKHFLRAAFALLLREAILTGEDHKINPPGYWSTFGPVRRKIQHDFWQFLVILFWEDGYRSLCIVR